MNRVDTRETVQSADQAVIRCESVTKTFREGRLNVPVLRGIDFTVDPGEQIAIIGASGSGKSTLLHILGGLAEPTTGKVIVNGQDINALGQAEQGTLRNQALGFVYQFHHLLPEFTALENVQMPLRIARTPGDIAGRATEALRLLGLGERLHHHPGALSGGEQQRVAIARALLSNPQLLVMDEPLGSIDTQARARILPYLQRLHDTLKIPVIYVSHALDEVLELADDVILLEAGHAMAKQSVFDFATAGPDADLPHGTAMIHCQVTGRDHDNDLTILSFENQTMYVATPTYAPGKILRLRIPSRDVSLALNKPGSSSILNILEGRISEIHDDAAGPTVVVIVRCGEQQILARITRKSLLDMKLTIDQQVYAQVKGVALMVNDER